MTLDRLHEFGNTKMSCLFHNCMWQSRHSEVDVYVLALCEQTDGLSTFNRSPCSNMICVYVFVCVFVFIYTCNRQWHTTLGLELVGSIVNFWIVAQLVFWSLSIFWTQFSFPVMFQGDLWRRPRWRVYFFVYDFSSFHPNNFRDTISWEYFVKNDRVRSSLIELQSFFQSKIDVDPIYRVLMFLPRCLHVLRKTRCFQVHCLRIFVFFIYRIHKHKEYCRFVAQILASLYQSWIHRPERPWRARR